MITITPNAAEEIIKVQAESEDLKGKLLRVAAVGGGCSGNRYQMGFDDFIDGDTKIESNGISILVDQNSLGLMFGSEIDLVDTPEGKSF
ncbi:MAG: iron-sulfur cluster assembly accessory protein, partial [Spirochaetia bacterium]|nr:iron-sulfur cluster assembly accessory protein [Spirochaetia bacterium]